MFYITKLLTKLNIFGGYLIKKIIIICITILIVIILTVIALQTVFKNLDNFNAKTLYVGHSNNSNFKTIQEAINASFDYDTIIIEKGIYNEALIINKNINLIGSGINQTIIEYNSKNLTNDYISVKMNSNNCKLQDLTIIKNNIISDTTAIYVNSSDNIISNIFITNFSKGIYLGWKTKNNIIKNNRISNNLIAIDNYGSSNNLIENNIIDSNSNNGIYLHAFSEENTIRKNIAKNNYYGIMIKGSDNNLVYNNCFRENNYGAYVCCDSRDNSIYHNIFSKNLINNSQTGDLLNYWHNDLAIGGNFWDDYNGVDENQDGYGDTPYYIPGSERQDIYPLIYPPEDINCNI